MPSLVGSEMCIRDRGKQMKKVLVVIDMQNDFIDGSLGTAEAQAIVGKVLEKIKAYPADRIYATRDTHCLLYTSPSPRD